eukprot:scaffold25392_cov72-Phaeocystis_antarctica.AAC.5
MLLSASVVTNGDNRAAGPTVLPAPTTTGPRLNLPSRVNSWPNTYAEAPTHAPSPSTMRSSSVDNARKRARLLGKRVATRAHG